MLPYATVSELELHVLFIIISLASVCTNSLSIIIVNCAGYIVSINCLHCSLYCNVDNVIVAYAIIASRLQCNRCSIIILIIIRHSMFWLARTCCCGGKTGFGLVCRCVARASRHPGRRKMTFFPAHSPGGCAPFFRLDGVCLVGFLHAFQSLSECSVRVHLSPNCNTITERGSSTQASVRST